MAKPGQSPKAAHHDASEREIADKLEELLSKLKRHNHQSDKKQKSMSIEAAKEATALFQMAIERYHHDVSRAYPSGVVGVGERVGAPSRAGGMGARKGSSLFASSVNMGNFPENDKPAGVREVEELVTRVTRIGGALQRAAAFRILLANVARRVLFIIRESAASAVKTIEELKAQAVTDEEVAAAVAAAGEGESEEAGSSDVEDASEWDSPASPGKAKPQFSSSDPDGDMELEPSSAPAAKPRSHGMFPASTPQPVGRSSIHPMPRESSSNEFMNHTPPTDGMTLVRVQSTMPNSNPEPQRANGMPIDFHAVIENTMAGLEELEIEYDKMTSTLCDHAAKQLYDGELVVTIGTSHTMLNFLLTAAEKKKFEVMILEGAPLGGAARMAKELEAKGITTRVLPDSSMWSVMAQASKVFVNAEAVLANGGLLAPIGTHPLAIAAEHHSVPIIVVTSTLKCSPYYPSDNQCTSLVKISKEVAEEVPWSTYSCPTDVLPLLEWPVVDMALGGIIVDSPVMEYVPPQLINLFVTNDGEFTVPQIHRLVRDHYHPEDGAL